MGRGRKMEGKAGSEEEIESNKIFVFIHAMVSRGMEKLEN